MGYFLALEVLNDCLNPVREFSEMDGEMDFSQRIYLRAWTPISTLENVALHFWFQNEIVEE